MAVTQETTAASPSLRSASHASAPSLLRSFRRARLESAGFPGWLRAVDTVHRAARSPITFFIDGAVLATCAYAIGASPAMAVGLSLVTLFAFYIGGLYGDRCSLESQGVIWFATAVAPPIAFTLLGAVALAHPFNWTVSTLLLAGAAGMGGLIAVRGITCAVLTVSRRRGLGLERALIVGDSRHASMLSDKLAHHPAAGLSPIAILPLEDEGEFAAFSPEFLPARQLTRAIKESGAQHVVLVPGDTDETILECMKGSRGLDVRFSMLPPLSELFLHPRMVTQVGGVPLLPLGRIADRHRAFPGKRFFDLVVASVLMIVLSPLFAVVALAIKLSDRGPVIYRQRRVGRHGRTFYMLKFRSMVPGAERQLIDLRDQNVNNGLLFKVRDDPRITPVGRVIRRLSIDELPQLWNVLRGHMSLVGPRPLPVNPEDFSPIDNERHAAPPGITGYWQVAGDHSLTYEEMVKLDLAYVENWTLWLDVLLLIRTVPALFNRRGPS
jgi:exopolysaccharide biosynthesis polyprenyl glycosylphosphotransferase